ncbi:UNVERIFIED_CONTAM: hypothetical protein FKN15_046981 [Acipenser sinensis]
MHSGLFYLSQKSNTAMEYVASHLSKIHGLDWHPDNEFILATSSQDNSVWFWDYHQPRKYLNILTCQVPVWKARYMVRNGHIKRITDNDIQSLVLEIEGTNVSTTYITCPADPKKTLGIKLPFLVMIIKNLKKYFTFEVQVLDDKNVRRRFRASNYQSTTRVKPFICTMPMRLDDGWNQIQFNLSDFTRRAYGTNYIETLRVQIHANCRIRRVYFSDRLYSEDELPAEFKLYLPVQNKVKVMHFPVLQPRTVVCVGAHQDMLSVYY